MKKIILIISLFIFTLSLLILILFINFYNKKGLLSHSNFSGLIYYTDNYFDFPSENKFVAVSFDTSSSQINIDKIKHTKTDSGIIYYYPFYSIKLSQKIKLIKTKNELLKYSFKNYLSDIFFKKLIPVYLMEIQYYQDPCSYQPGYIFYKKLNEYDRKTLEQILRDFISKFNYNYFNLDRFDTLRYNNDHVLDYISYEEKDGKPYFEVLCKSYFEYNKGSIRDYFSTENENYLKSIIVYFKNNYDLFKILGCKKIIIPLRYQTYWIENNK